MLYLSLFDNIIRIRIGKSRRFQQIHDFGTWHYFFVQKVLIFFCPNNAAQKYFFAINLQKKQHIK